MESNDPDLSGIEDEKARAIIEQLMNFVEALSSDLREARAEIQRLRDEIKRLKGEQGQPKVKGNTPKQLAVDHSSEQERRKARPRHKSSKKAEIRIDREETREIEAGSLPADAEFKGYRDVVVQDIRLVTDNVLFHKAKYYSARLHQSYQAELPLGYSGQYGPGIQALCLTLYYGLQASEPKILEFFTHVGIQVSAGEISNWLIQDQTPFHAEKDALYTAGLASSPYQQTDDTLTRVDGQNQHCHIICNPVYTTYHTYPRRDRLTVLDVLRNGRARQFRMNAEALAYLQKQSRWSKAAWSCLQRWVSQDSLDEPVFLERLEIELPGLGPQLRKELLDAAAIAAYHAEVGYPVVRVLICDDAAQFHGVTEQMMQCWVHEGRHYKTLVPVFTRHRQHVSDFLTRFWDYYDQLLAYCNNPGPAQQVQLQTEFDTLFSTHTGYAALDQRIAKTNAKKEILLLVLQFPELPLHNNAAELAVRQRVRKRDVSFGPRTKAGVRAWDTFASLAATTKKLGINFFQYLQDRVSATHQIPPLSDLVTQAAKERHLGWSFPPA
jgi:hypothetical protein